VLSIGKSERYAMFLLNVPAAFPHSWLTISQSNVLLVGAGGIGCELLKNLVLTSFGSISIIDLDTIDLSNLNRQFLFRHEHIKKPKAIVAKEAAQQFNPNVKLTAYHANIKDPQFNIEWFAGFDLVFNALDNLEARRHVNRMCLAADVPLIESGTTGFNGQVQVIRKGKTACYDCNPKTTPKSFPICTIRSTPSQPIHCIVWAKSYLVPELFGESEDVAEVDTTEDSENAGEIENLRKETQALKKIRETMGSADFARNVFDKVFSDDIDRLRKMEDAWKTRKPPEILSYGVLQAAASGISPSISLSDQITWSRNENFTVFNDSLQRLARRFLDSQSQALKDGSAGPSIAFDKDDEDTLDLVAAAANLRSDIFSISTKSKFDIKQMAGNIIPAIATTNAMVAGLCVMQAFKVLREEYFRAKMIFLDRGTMSASQVDQPNPDCAVCGVAMSRIEIDPTRATLSDIVNGVLKMELGYGEEITVMNEKGPIYDPDYQDNLTKKLEDLSIGDASFLVVKDDDDEDPRVDLQLSITAKSLPEGKAVLLPSKPEIARKPKKTATVEYENSLNTNGGSVTNGSVFTIAKRKREASDDLEEVAPNKSTKPTNFKDRADVVVIDGGEEGAIELD
jgi:ubiquitin-like 1-activating enzyme E1 B